MNHIQDGRNSTAMQTMTYISYDGEYNSEFCFNEVQGHIYFNGLKSYTSMSNVDIYAIMHFNHSMICIYLIMLH